MLLVFLVVFLKISLGGSIIAFFPCDPLFKFFKLFYSWILDFLKSFLELRIVN